MKLPQVQAYSDPIRFLRACHAVIEQQVMALEGLVQEAKKVGLKQSFASNAEWGELLQFFSIEAAGHEKDEEAGLFPFVLEKEQRVGFLPADSPIRFLVDGHAYLVSKVESLLDVWKQFLNKADPSSEASEHFISIAEEMVKAYREHISTEENLVYKHANDILTPAERMVILERIYQRHDNEVSMPMLNFAQPTFTENLKSVPLDYTDATSSVSISEEPTEEEEEDVPKEE